MGRKLSFYMCAMSWLSSIDANDSSKKQIFMGSADPTSVCVVPLYI